MPALSASNYALLRFSCCARRIVGRGVYFPQPIFRWMRPRPDLENDSNPKGLALATAGTKGLNSQLKGSKPQA
jgi:hypothetical protein